METVDEKYILSAIDAIRKQRQRPDKVSIAAHLDRKHGLGKSAVTRTIDYMLDSAAIYCKPRNGKDSYYIFDPLRLCESDEEVIDSEIDFAQSFEPHDVAASTKTTEPSPHKSFLSPRQSINADSDSDSDASFDSTFGFLGVMGKLADSIKELNKLLCLEKERNESLAANLNSKMEENFELKLRIQVLEAAVNNTPTLLRRENATAKNAPTQRKCDNDEAPAQEEPCFRSQWDSYVSKQSRQYEQYQISKKVSELKSSNPEGTNKKSSNRAKTCNEIHNIEGPKIVYESIQLENENENDKRDSKQSGKNKRKARNKRKNRTAKSSVQSDVSEKDEIPSGDPSEVNSSSDVDQTNMATKAQKVACNSKVSSSSSSENNSTSPIVNNDNAELPSTSGIPDKGPAKKANAVAKQPPSTNNNKRRTAVIIGDSLVKNIKAWELKEKCDSSGNVYVKCFNGATIKDMKCYTQPTIERKPNLIILHAGTNDLSLKLNSGQKSELQIANEIIELANSIKENGIEVVISGLLPRGDRFETNRQRVNFLLADLCSENNYAFLEHANIDPSKHLNSSKVHLNKVGDSVFENNLLRALNF